MIKIDAIFVNKKLVFALHVPLVQIHRFSIYNLLPLPLPSSFSNELFHFIEPNFQFLLIDKVKTKYSKLQNLDSCLSLDKEYICENPIIFQTVSAPICEVLLLTQPFLKLHDSCQINSFAANAEIWHKLKGNNWLFILSKPSTLTVECTKSAAIQNEPLPVTGIVSLKSDCRGYSAQTMLYAENQNYSVFENDVIPNVNLNREEFVSEFVNKTSF